MDAESPTPYSTPETAEFLSPSEIAQMKRPVLPPLKLWRLAGAIAMVTGGLVSLWALVHHQQSNCIVVAVMCCLHISTFLDPNDLRYSSRPVRSFLSKLVGSGAFLAFFFAWMWRSDLPAVFAVLEHPAAYCAAWLAGCALILTDWWKRRNNPPYQPDLEVDLVAFSRWKRMRRLGIRD